VGDILLKRDDLFEVAGVRGGKVRSCWSLSQGAPGLITAGSRASPQVNIVAHIAKQLGVPCRVHVPSGALAPEVAAARDAGAEVIQHRPGYNSVIVARAREDAERTGWREIPFGMECGEAVRATASQVAGLPWGQFGRIVVPVGSGMSLAGVLHGLVARGAGIPPVLGVVVGADPLKRLDAYAPAFWRDLVTLVPSGLDYHDEAPKRMLGGVALDPIYEAKCLPFLRPGDLLWVVGIRQTAA
jgi:1-aminocyclopropane-1-carboxylate deaminase/D-cysteine desulfhydrase-like pyridoxal-dependent ACC family enzyme